MRCKNPRTIWSHSIPVRPCSCACTIRCPPFIPHSTIPLIRKFIGAEYDGTCEYESLSPAQDAHIGDLTTAIIKSGHWMAQVSVYVACAVIVYIVCAQSPCITCSVNLGR